METIFALWQRDIILFFRDKARILGTFAMPFFFLFILGDGINSSMSMMAGASGGLFSEISYNQYMFPGVVAVTVLVTSLYSALSIVEDKEYGYLKEVLVSPVSRTYVVIGKILGGACVAAMQGVLILIFAPFLDIKITITAIVEIIPGIFLVGFTLSAIGIFVACGMKTSSGFQAVEQLMMYPMLFLSGALYPINNLPAWMNILIRINPVTYAVDMFKKLILPTSSLSSEALKELELKVLGHVVTLTEEVVLILILGVVFIILGSIKINKKE